MTLFDGQVALVAGVETPAGRAIALRLAADGARIFVTAGTLLSAEACADEINRAGGRAAAGALDLLSEESWIGTLTAASRRWGRLDMQVTCAGTDHAPSVIDAAMSDVTALFDTQVLAPWLGLKHGIGTLRAAGKGGAIVLVAAAGQRPQSDLAGAAIQGLRLMTRSAAVECGAARDGIRVNAVEAGMANNGAPVRAVDIASAVRHLLSPDARFTTGTTLAVAGAPAQPPVPAYTPRDEGPLQGKVALVTGATSGLGRACAVSLARRGVRLVLTGRNVERGAETLALVRAAGSDGLVLSHDVTSEAEWKQVMRAATQSFGPLDILVNNAGDRRPARLLDASYDDARYILRVNVHSTLLGIKHGQAAMAPRGGVILNMSSIGGISGSVGNVDYSAAKAMVTYVSKVAAAELAPRGIRVIAVSPGIFFTEGFYRNRPDAEQAERDKQRAAATIPLGRAGDPAELGETMAYLVSDDARAMTGNDFVTDGGATA
jgi:3alpha(or 20beta)-hydroxysteroid dehydrogenase